MRFTSFFALGALAFPALASPVVGVVGNTVKAVGEVVDDTLETVADLIFDCDAVEDAAIYERQTPIASPEDVISTCKGLLVTIQLHTAAINKTVASVPAGTKCTDADVASIKVQLNLVVDAIKVVVTAIGAVEGILECTVEQVQTIVGLVLCIVIEIVCTLLYVIKTLDIKDLLIVLISNVCKVLACLILILEHVVGGVLELVLGLLNSTGILPLVGGLLGGLLTMLSSGKILPL